MTGAGRVLLVGVLLTLLAGCQPMASGDETTVPWDLVEAPQADDEQVPLLLAAESGCGPDAELPRVADVEVDETAAAVTITTSVEPSDDEGPLGDCSGTGIGIPVTARLAAPLGERRLVDGACHEADLQGHALCEEGKTFDTEARQP